MTSSYLSTRTLVDLEILEARFWSGGFEAVYGNGQCPFITLKADDKGAQVATHDSTLVVTHDHGPMMAVKKSTPIAIPAALLPQSIPQILASDSARQSARKLIEAVSTAMTAPERQLIRGTQAELTDFIDHLTPFRVLISYPSFLGEHDTGEHVAEALKKEPAILIGISWFRPTEWTPIFTGDILHHIPRTRSRILDRAQWSAHDQIAAMGWLETFLAKCLDDLGWSRSLLEPALESLAGRS